MDREKAKKILGEGATEEQVTNFLNEWHIAKKEEVATYEKQLGDLKNQMNKYSDYDDIKSQLDEINRAKMTEQEKIEEEKKQSAEYLKKSKLIYSTAKAKEILAGLNLEDDLISLVVSDDLDKTIASANKLKAKFESQKEFIAKETKESLSTLNLDPPLPNVNQNDGIMTFDKFGKLSAEEQEKFINEHPEEFENME